MTPGSVVSTPAAIAALIEPAPSAAHASERMFIRFS
jgi:hypothetical protein